METWIACVGCSSCIFELRDVVISKASKGSSIIQSHTFDKENIEYIFGGKAWTIQQTATGAVTAFGKKTRSRRGRYVRRQEGHVDGGRVPSSAALVCLAQTYASSIQMHKSSIKSAQSMTRFPAFYFQHLHQRIREVDANILKRLVLMAFVCLLTCVTMKPRAAVPQICISGST